MHCLTKPYLAYDANLLREHQHCLSLKNSIVAVWLHKYDVFNHPVASTSFNRPWQYRVPGR